MFRPKIWIAFLGLFLIGFGNGMAADVDVEGIYTASGSTVVAEIYANINDTTPILSYGIKLGYDSGQMSVTSAEKNESVWFFGDGTPAGNKPYMNPDTATAGQVIIIGGTLNTADPTGGVTGRRILLGRVTFNRGNIAYKPALTLDYAKVSPYSNFVRTDGTVLDGTANISLTTTIFQLGDASKNGTIDSADLISVRNHMTNGTYSIIADCSCNSKMDSADLICIKNKIGK